jgi:hypothetical protein
MIYCTEADPEVTLTVKESSITDTVTDPETQETTTLFHNGVRRFNKANPDDLTIVDNYSNSLSLYKGINIIELKAGVSKADADAMIAKITEAGGKASKK